jgi:ankyrin repeat protein
MGRYRAAFLAAVLFAAAFASGASGARAQGSNVTPLNNTNVNGGTTVPFGGFGSPDKPDYVAQSAASNDAGEVLWYAQQHFDLDKPDDIGRTALIYAAINNNMMVAKILIDHGASLDARDPIGNTALHMAADRGNLDVLRQLLDAKAPIDAQNHQGVTPLMMAANNGRADAVKLLLKYKADTGKEDYTGRDAIGWAGNKTAVVQLLKNPASVQ